MRQWIDLLEGAHGQSQTLWINIRTGKIIDCEEEGAAHHNEFAVDNPERLNIRATSAVLRNARDSDYEDMVADVALRREAMKKKWARCNYDPATGWLSVDAMTEADVFEACHILLAKEARITSLTMELAGNHASWQSQGVGATIVPFVKKIVDNAAHAVR
ncbi:MAG: hypothetical protein EOO77_27900 [Oxalobacteraceae bacterium]|nr:MAG: hypothetical protein EOO77_27900 [Oxalobacteraceae bacterium]